MSDFEAPKVFISYAHYDGDSNHRPKVFALSERLRSMGIDCHIDQYEENDPPSSWPRWMTEQINESDYVLVLCTSTYQRRFEGKEEHGKGLGATWEGGAITTSIYNAGGGKHKFIPITFGDRPSQQMYIPSPLDSTTSYNIESEAGIDRLLRRLHRAPEISKGPLGSRPDFNKAIPLESDPIENAHRESRRLISEPIRAIQTHQYYRSAIKDATDALTAANFPQGSPEPTAEAFRERISAYETCVEPLAAALSELAYFDKSDQLDLLTLGIKGVYQKEPRSGMSFNCWSNLWQYPSTFCLYAAGIAAMHARNYEALYKLIIRTQITNPYREEERIPLVARANIPYTFQKPWAEWLDQPLERAKYPGSEYMVRRYRRTLGFLLPADEVELAFDQFEHFLSLVLHDSSVKGVLCGRFCYKLEWAVDSTRSNPITEPILEGLDEQEDWKALRVGFFGRDFVRARDAFTEHFKAASKPRM